MQWKTYFNLKQRKSIPVYPNTSRSTLFSHLFNTDNSKLGSLIAAIVDNVLCLILWQKIGGGLFQTRSCNLDKAEKCCFSLMGLKVLT